MFKRIKQAVENWLRGIIKEEVGRCLTKEVYPIANQLGHLDVSLQLEKMDIKEQLASFNEALSRLNAMSFFKENAALRATIKQMDAQLATIADKFKKLHPTA